MLTSDESLLAVRAILHEEPALQAELDAIDIRLEDGSVVLEGQVADIASKRLASHLAATVEGVTGVLDRLRLIPEQVRADSEILEAIFQSLSREPVFSDYNIDIETKPAARTPPSGRGMIGIGVQQAVARLSGQVGSLTHKRMADVLCWWTMGIADVHNALHVVPPEQDGDDEITDALRIVLEKDPLLDPNRLDIQTLDQVVYLRGSLPLEAQKRAAEHDAWYILGVHKVVNNIDVA